ncbi:MAG: hypothetical protein LQ350_006051 [Teloschistes chrysophthalmus]|nr:MAG: hypothetical protein LQ350_006051 [Niorma chrysophthalma]
MNLTQTNIQNAENQQRTLNTQLPDFLTFWQREYEALVVRSAYIVPKLKVESGLAQSLRDNIREMYIATRLARKSVINSWPIARQGGRTMGIFEYNPPELWDFDHVLEDLLEREKEIRGYYRLMTAIISKVTSLNDDLGNLTLKVLFLDAELHSRSGPDRLDELQRLVAEIKNQTKCIRKSINRARVNYWESR